MSDRHIVALGGGGFSDDDPRLDDFILGLCGKQRPKVCFVGTATGDSSFYLRRFYDAFPRGRADPSHLALFSRPNRPLEELLDEDVVYVGGGSTANLLAVWKLHGLDAVLREAWERGVVLAGVSAGGMCWFEAGVTDSFGALAALHDCLGLLAGAFCPHYDGEADRRPTLHQLVEDGFPAAWAVENGVGLHFVGTELAEAVSSRADGRAFRVRLAGDGVDESAVPARYLG
jgi:dipeptidase E